MKFQRFSVQFKFSLAIFLGTTLSLASANNLAFAQSSLTGEPDPAAPTISPKDLDKGLPKSGLLSSTYTAGYQNKSVASPWNRAGAPLDASAPLSGSVSRTSNRQWIMNLSNNTDDSFDASVKVSQSNKSGSTVKTDSFSFRLKPRESVQRPLAAPSDSTDAQLELLSWKRILAIKATPSPTLAPVPQTEAQKAEEVRKAIMSANGSRSITPLKDEVKQDKRK